MDGRVYRSRCCSSTFNAFAVLCNNGIRLKCQVRVARRFVANHYEEVS